MDHMESPMENQTGKGGTQTPQPGTAVDCCKVPGSVKEGEGEA